MSGMIFGMLIAYLVIDELDEGIISYYKITPFGGKNYLRARFLLPLIVLIFLFIIISVFFTLLRYNIWKLLSIWLFSITQMYLTGMIIIALSGNKLEALVVSKMLGFQILPYVLTIFEKSNYRYLFSFVPSLFLGIALEKFQSYLYYIFILISLNITILFILFFKKKFFNKLYKNSQN